ncbi:MAG: 4'-phosphopantetheinyl transferase superfamily protein [Candidatus Omnitrophica bacterium]|nr:4'-phosphopantetheinyl transferase superfamily protein [Candidatus Omnitrophota bacterium]
MINFSIHLESIDDFKNPARVYDFLSKSEIKNKNLISLIGKIAAKKAFLKCLGLKDDYKKIEVKNSNSGKPYLEIIDKTLKKKLKNKKFSISISHTKNLAIAVCLIYERKT